MIRTTPRSIGNHTAAWAMPSALVMPSAFVMPFALVAAVACGGSPRQSEAPPAAQVKSADTAGTDTAATGEAATGAADAAGGTTPAGTAAITGRARFTGQPPQRRPIRMSGEAACHKPGGDPPLAEDVQINADGALRNVWVRVVGGPAGGPFPAPAKPVEVDQKGCLFVPHVVLARAGQPILFRNSDPVLHNINALARVNRGFNLSLPAAGMTTTRTFAKPEAVRIKCDVHTWMGGWIVVHDNPYQALSGDDGRFEIAGLPAGTFQVEAWHEALGTSKQEVTVADGGRGEVEFSFTRPAR